MPIYLDYAAATPVAPEVMRAMRPFWSDIFANASSLHRQGLQAQQAVTAARKTAAAFLNAQNHEIVFTSGGTESINLALKGYVHAMKQQDSSAAASFRVSEGKQHIISTTLEHAATRETLNAMRTEGHRVTMVPCETHGIVSVPTILAAITKTTTLVSIIHAQNEIGTVQPVAEIGKALIGINRERAAQGLPRIALHVDACQSAAWLALDADKLHADLLTLDASKLYGPKGIGLLYIRNGTPLEPLLHGGGQEQGLRSGTEPTALIIGFAAALLYIQKNRAKAAHRSTALQDYMIRRIEKEIPGAKLTGDRVLRLPNNIHITIPDHEGETMVLRLDRHGIAASTGSACSTAEGSDSHIMRALKLPAGRRNGSLRFSLGFMTTRAECLHAIAALKRSISS